MDHQSNVTGAPGESSRLYVVRQSGTVRILERGRLRGAADWSHQHANAGNTASSGDTRVRGPLGLLWFGDPGPDLNSRFTFDQPFGGRGCGHDRVSG